MKTLLYSAVVLLCVFAELEAQVVCPGFSYKENTYCDCDGDCLDQPKWCSCSDAQACCGLEEKFTIKGEIIKTNQTHQIPAGIKIYWHNMLEGDDVRDGTAWRWTGGTSTVNGNNFSLTMEMTKEMFDQNITTSSKVIPWLTTNLNVTSEEIGQVKFAMGHIFGYFGDLNKTFDLFRQPPEGKYGENALADVYNVFYRNGPEKDFKWKKRGKERNGLVGWDLQFPQGFSCGRGAPRDISSGHSFERFVPVDCSEIILKVASKRCERNEKFDQGLPNEMLYHNRPDCMSGINWT